MITKYMSIVSSNITIYYFIFILNFVLKLSERLNFYFFYFYLQNINNLF